MAVTIEPLSRDFVNMFEQYDRGEQFTYCARAALYDYYDEVSEGMGEDVKIDIIGVCCEWTEYERGELLREYSRYLPDERDTYETEADAVSALIEALRDETQVIELRNGNTLVLCF